MKLQHLRFFTSVVECGGIGKAATQLHVSQPAISAGLKALEGELGRPLFEKRPGKLRNAPTPKAMRFYQQALEILGRCESARAEFQVEESRPPRLRVGVIPTINAASVVSLAIWLNARRSNWRGQIWESSATQLVASLKQGRIDVAWTLTDSAPRSQIIWSEPYVVLAARNHPLANGSVRDLSLKDINAEPLILRGSCDLKAGELRDAGLSMKIAAKADRDDLALKLVAQGVGVVIAPRSLATKEVAILPAPDLHLSRTIGFIWRKGLPKEAVVDILNAATALRRS